EDPLRVGTPLPAPVDREALVVTTPARWSTARVGPATPGLALTLEAGTLEVGTPERRTPRAGASGAGTASLLPGALRTRPATGRPAPLEGRLVPVASRPGPRRRRERGHAQLEGCAGRRGAFAVIEKGGEHLLRIPAAQQVGGEHARG